MTTWQHFLFAILEVKVVGEFFSQHAAFTINFVGLDCSQILSVIDSGISV